jgi:hypothetical protein
VHLIVVELDDLDLYLPMIRSDRVGSLDCSEAAGIAPGVPLPLFVLPVRRRNEVCLLVRRFPVRLKEDALSFLVRPDYGPGEPLRDCSVAVAYERRDQPDGNTEGNKAD